MSLHVALRLLTVFALIMVFFTYQAFKADNQAIGYGMLWIIGLTFIAIRVLSVRMDKQQEHVWRQRKYRK